MANLMEKAREQIDALLADACVKAAAEGLFPADAALKGSVEVPKEARNGDYAANHAMAGAKDLRMPPRRIAEILTDRLALEDSYFASAEIAGPGFINFRLSEKWYAAVLSVRTCRRPVCSTTPPWRRRAAPTAVVKSAPGSG